MLIGYSRIASASQDHASQADALEKAGCQRIFAETMTGTRADRPELESLLTYVRAGDTLCVYRLDRLSRSLRDLFTIRDRLEKLEISLTSLSEAIASNSPSGRLAVHMLAALGQHEVESIRARCAAGRAAAIARGRLGGRPRALHDHKAPGSSRPHGRQRTVHGRDRATGGVRSQHPLPDATGRVEVERLFPAAARPKL